MLKLDRRTLLCAKRPSEVALVCKTTAPHETRIVLARSFHVWPFRSWPKGSPSINLNLLGPTTVASLHPRTPFRGLFNCSAIESHKLKCSQ
jgi:hypothetical protein